MSEQAPKDSTLLIEKPEESHYCKALIFAPSGHGKTHFLGTAQDDDRTNPMLLLDYEGGTSTLVNRDIDIVRIRSWEDYNKAYSYLMTGKHPYRSVGLDSISETHVFALLHLLDTDPRSRKYPDLLEQGDYGIALVQMRRLLRAFRDLPLHVFAVSMAKDDTDPYEGVIKKPALAGALSDEAPGIFDVVGYLAMTTSTDENTPGSSRVLVLQNYPKIRAKVRVPWGATPPDEIINPTITALLDVLQIPHPEPVKEKKHA